ncbi:retron system putative HNH endonuclease [Rhizobium rhizogenes]
MITKGAEPNSLTYHRAQAHSDYDNYAQKDDLRTALVGEQKGLCCYCTGRVRAESTAMKIEHWQSQASYPERQLIYANLLGACLGGDGRSPTDQHCDTKKANRDLKWNPADTAHAIEARLKYLVDGTILSLDDEFNTQLNDTLGLNLRYMKSSRKAVLDSVLQWWRSTPDARQKVQQQISYRINAAEYQPFSPVAIWFLRQKL